MIVGLGIDVTELARIARALERFRESFTGRILTPGELDAMPTRHPGVIVAWVAARFAAKEAASKALGTGFQRGVSFQNIEIRSLPSGKPELFFHDQALALFHELGASRAYVSLTHSRETAAAVVVLET